MKTIHCRDMPFLSIRPQSMLFWSVRLLSITSQLRV
uniref:Uncharacterized protein n=1 Tax=Myoviridae sp. ctwwN25 TaxID=2825209 RepID=A0A8S5PPI3_9CAUD|nr:MAG TPA: hypothetical protein [Myoviridae sp. ctwwN25]